MIYLIELQMQWENLYLLMNVQLNRVVLIEVKVTRTLPEEVTVMDPNGGKFQPKV